MEFYHGTTVGGITELQPFIGDNLKDPCVYLTTNKQLALHYILDKKNRIGSCPMLDIRSDGVLVFQEMFNGALGVYLQRIVGLCLPLCGRLSAKRQDEGTHVCHVG
jgi:hypothetical protein